MVINQIHSIGDILFIEPICRYFWNKNGEKPILPVRDHLIWLSEYIESANFVKMSEFQLDYDSLDTSNPDYLPLRFANPIVRGLQPEDYSDYENCMPDKYILAGLEPDLWRGLKINFKIREGMRLFEELGLKFGEYILVNEHSQAGSIEINPKTDKKVVKMGVIKGFTVLDWWFVMLNADEIHSISTSTFYIFQAIKGLNCPVFIYPRPNEDGLRGVSKLKVDYDIILIIL